MSIHVRRAMFGRLSWAVAVLFGAQAIAGQNPPAPSAPAKSEQVIRSRADLVTSDVIVRDRQGRFVSDLKQDEFDVYEDGVKQEVVTFTMSHGGRVINASSSPRPPIAEGVVLPPSRPANDTSGRVFLTVVDDLHLDARGTSQVRSLLKRISKELIHDGDLFGVVSTGKSSIAINLTYDRQRLDQAINRIMGEALRPSEILAVPQGQQGSPEIRHRAHVAFSTVYEILNKLSEIHDRRKTVIYLSNGYDFNPFADARAKQESERNPPQSDNSQDPARKERNEFAFADLISELSEVTRAANRANASIFTIDPRGLSAGPDLDEPVNMVEWNAHIRTTQDTLRVLAEQTGGTAVINQNDFSPALKRIDAETSDYYMIGYYSTNSDPLKRHRQVTVRVKRPDLEVRHRREYSLKPPPEKTPRSK
jgi:VWFA-related protein